MPVSFGNPFGAKIDKSEINSADLGLNDGQICVLPSASQGQVLKRGASAWEAGTDEKGAFERVVYAGSLGGSSSITLNFSSTGHSYYIGAINVYHNSDVAETITMQINGDASTVYEYSRIKQEGTTLTADNVTSATSFEVAKIENGAYGHIQFKIFCYSDAPRYVDVVGGDSTNQYRLVGRWGYTSTISSLVFTVSGGVFGPACNAVVYGGE